MRSSEFMCEDIEYIPQLPPKFGNINYEAKGGVLTETTPEKYLKACLRLEIGVSNQNKIDELKQKIRSGQPLDPVAFTLQNGKVVKHDGRHRAAAAFQLGIKTIPLILFSIEGPITKRVIAQKSDRVIEL